MLESTGERENGKKMAVMMSEKTKMRLSVNMNTTQTQLSEEENSNTLRVLIATDNHLGFEERDAVRKEDSFLAFEEILRTARERY